MAITIGSDVVSAVASATGNTLDGLWPLIAFAIGIPLGFYLMRRVIAMLPRAGK